MPNQLHEQVIPFVPAFMAYEKSLVEWFGKIKIPRDDRHLQFRVEYAGGEKAIRAIKALKGDDSRSERARQPVITIRLQNVEPNTARYHPPESPVGILYDGPKHLARRAARISKPAGYKITYAVEFHALYEQDLRYAMGVILQQFSRYGGNLSYLRMRYPTDGVGKSGPMELFPVWMRSYSHNVQEGDSEREVKASATFEVEAYLGLPFHFVPTFRHYIQEITVQGSPGEAIVSETTTVTAPG